MPTVLLIEDDHAIAQVVQWTLTGAGFELLWADSAEKAQLLLSQAGPPPAAVILDWMLPGGDGLSLLRLWQRHNSLSQTPKLMLTARHGDEDKLRAFDLGVDDYLTKPFSPLELLARLRALLRRQNQHLPPQWLEHGPFRLEVEAHRLWLDGREIHLSPTEFRLFKHLLSQPQRVHSRAQLLQQLNSSDSDERAIDAHIRRLRQSLEPAGDWIVTVRGSGYRLATEKQ